MSIFDMSKAYVVCKECEKEVLLNEWAYHECKEADNEY